MVDVNTKKLRPRYWLFGALLGALACDAAWLILGFYREPAKQSSDIILQFNRSEYEARFVDALLDNENPETAIDTIWDRDRFGFDIRETETSVEAVTLIASKCDVEQWHLESSQHGDITSLIVRSVDLDSKKFSCLAQITHSPFGRFVSEAF